MCHSEATSTEGQRTVRKIVAPYCSLGPDHDCSWHSGDHLALDLYVGRMFLIGGAVGILAIFFAPTISAFIWSLFSSALSRLGGFQAMQALCLAKLPLV